MRFDAENSDFKIRRVRVYFVLFTSGALGQVYRDDAMAREKEFKLDLLTVKKQYLP